MRHRAPRVVLLLIGVAALIRSVVAFAGWQTFGPADGLTLWQVRNVYVDSKDDIWFAGLPGWIHRYDGQTFTTYDLYIGGDLSFAEDAGGRLWIAADSSGRLARFDGAELHAFEDTELPFTGTTVVASDRAGDIWTGHSAGVSRLTDGTWTTYGPGDGLVDVTVSAILQSCGGAYWFGTQNGLSRWSGSGWSTFTVANGLGENHVRCLVEDETGVLWVGGGETISRFDGASWTVLRRGVDYPDIGISGRGICVDALGGLWIGGSGGVAKLDEDGWKMRSVAELPATGYVRDIAPDRDGNLWVASYASGAARFGGEWWDLLTTEDGLPSPTVLSVAAAGAGEMWVGTNSGLVQCIGDSVTTYTTADGMLSDVACDLLLRRDGRLCVGHGCVFPGGLAGISVFDGRTWSVLPTEEKVNDLMEDAGGDLWVAMDSGKLLRIGAFGSHTYDLGDGTAGPNWIYAVVQDRAGTIWAANYTAQRIYRFDGVTWEWFEITSPVYDLASDSEGNLWAATWDQGVFRFDGQSWTNFTTEDGLANYSVLSLFADSDGDIWCGTSRGVSLFRNGRLATFTASDGLRGSGLIRSMSETSGGRILIARDGATSGGVCVYEKDRVPPRTLLTSKAPSVSASRRQTVAFAAAYGETRGIEFSHSLDDGSWSEWSVTNAWTAEDLADRVHEFRIRARDRLGNVDPDGVRATVEIDGTPPVPVIAHPGAGQVVRGHVAVSGTAADARFESYRVDVRALPAGDWQPLIESRAAISNGALATWNTTRGADGPYELRLSENDSLGLATTTLATVIVDNEAPWASETAPAAVSAAAGGHVFTANREISLYFPPHAFASDVVVTATALTTGDVPDTLERGALRVLPGYEIAWGGSALRKPATLELAVPDDVPAVAGVLALYFGGADGRWERLGGTLDAGIISAPVTHAGRYALFSDDDAGAGAAALSKMSVTPRVFSPSGSFAADEAAISFSLGRAASVTVTVYNRAGRLVKEVAIGRAMSAGANLVRWDGRDRKGDYVIDGIYMVTVEVLGRTQTRSLAVVR